MRKLILFLIILVIYQGIAFPKEGIGGIFEKSLKAYKEGNYEKAIDSLNALISSFSRHQDIPKWYYWLGVIYRDFISKLIDEEMQSNFWELSKLSDKQFLDRYEGTKNDRSKIIEGTLIHEVAYKEVIERYSKHKRYIRKVPLSFNVEYNNDHFKKVLEYKSSPYVEDARFYILYSEGDWGDPEIVFRRFREFMEEYPKSKYADKVLLLFARLAQDAWEFSFNEIQGGKSEFRELGLELYRDFLNRYPDFPEVKEIEAEYNKLLKREFDNVVYGIGGD